MYLLYSKLTPYNSSNPCSLPPASSVRSMPMKRSLKLRSDALPRVEMSLRVNGFLSQKALAEDVGLALSTVSNFLTGKPVDRLTFVEICHRLDLEWRDIADLEIPAGTTPVVTRFPYNPPLPDAEPELPEGQVDLSSAFYVERVPVEALCYQNIVKPGGLVRIKAPRQMGKTSLLARILHYSSTNNHITIPLNFQLLDEPDFSNIDRLLQRFAASVARQLRLPNRLQDYWEDFLGSKVNCTTYFQEYLLPESKQNLVLGLDEVDRIFQYPEVAADFLGMLRAWHEAAKNDPIWKQLKLVLVHSTEVYIPLNINQSPFNVGLAVELTEFTPEQVQDLAQRHQLKWDRSQVEQLMAMVGGHPYLIRLALYHVALGMELTELLNNAPTESGLYGEHLRRHLWNLEQNSRLSVAMKAIVEAEIPCKLNSMDAFHLHSMGLIHMQKNECLPMCNLYRIYFRDRLV
jgi:transcriptional regulator with XRE-family HTH domain